MNAVYVPRVPRLFPERSGFAGPLAELACLCGASAQVGRRAWDSNPRRRSRASAVFKTAAIVH